MKKLLLSLLALPIIALASDTGESCSKLSDDRQRLACYDSVFLVNKQSDTAVEQKKTEWEYFEDKDEMRGVVNYFAGNFSRNKVNIGFPYGEVFLAVLLRQRQNGNDIMFTLDKNAQFASCSNDCKFIIKFDDQKIEEYQMARVENNASNSTLFIIDTQRFMNKLHNAKKMIVEVSIFDRGTKQFTFDVSNLEWKHF